MGSVMPSAGLDAQWLCEQVGIFTTIARATLAEASPLVDSHPRELENNFLDRAGSFS
jgi:hypothetical protein